MHGMGWIPHCSSIMFSSNSSLPGTYQFCILIESVQDSKPTLFVCGIIGSSIYTTQFNIIKPLFLLHAAHYSIQLPSFRMAGIFGGFRLHDLWGVRPDSAWLVPLRRNGALPEKSIRSAQVEMDDGRWIWVFLCKVGPLPVISRVITPNNHL